MKRKEGADDGCAFGGHSILVSSEVDFLCVATSFP